MGRIIFSFVLCCLFNVLHAQYRVDYQHYSTGDGLSHGSVVTMMKDSRGFMWFSTWDGLDRFDGINFKTFKTTPGDSLSLSSNRITEILEDKSNAIWLLTYDSRIFRLDLETEKFDDDVNSINNRLSGGIEQVFLSSKNEIWLATEKDGLFRIVTDTLSRQIKINQYSSHAEPGLHIGTDNILSVFEDGHQNIWYTSGKGINTLSASGDFNVNSLPTGISSTLGGLSFNCHAIAGTEIILGSKQGCIIFYDTKRLTTDSIQVSPSSITALLPKGDLLYAGTEEDGLYLINRKRHTIVQHYFRTFLSSVYQIYEDSSGLIWLETNAGGVVKVDPGLQDAKHFIQDVDVENVRHVISRCHFVEVNEVLWMSLKGGGFGYYNREQDSFDYFYNAPGSTQNKMSNFVYCFYIDDSNVLWLSTYRKGIEKFTLLNKHFIFFSPNPGSDNYLDNEVRALYEDHLGILWLATKSGDVYLMDGAYRIISHFSSEYKLPPSLVYAITEDENGTIWLGTKGNGIFMISREVKGGFSYRQFLESDNSSGSLSNNRVYHIEEGHDNSVWIATYGGGLNQLEIKDKEYIFRNSEEDFPGYPDNSCTRIRQVKKDSKGNLWLATTEGLVFCRLNDADKTISGFHRYIKVPGDPHSIGNNDVYCIYEDRNDTLWFGTLGGGLQKLIHYPSNDEPALFEVYTRENGLSSDVILSIEGDKKNNLWMSSENGLIKYSSAEKVFRNYDRHDGIDVASFSEAASTLRLNGDLVFGTYDGICYFNPGEIAEDPLQTSIYFTGLKLLNEEVKVGGDEQILTKSTVFTQDLKFSHKQNVFEFSFVALDFRAAQKLQYLYKLEGFDKQWRQSAVGNASYSRVPPGKYVFKVELQNPDISLEQACNIYITVRKPFWKSGAAFLIYTLLSLLLVYSAIQILISIVRLRNKVVIEKQLSDLKMNFFTNISHELRTPLTLIQGPVQEISMKEKLSDKGREYLELIQRNSEKMLRLVNQLLDFRKIQKKKMHLSLEEVKIDDFIRNICNAFRNDAREKKIVFSYILKKTNLNIWIDKEKIESVLYNLISNAFKFTPPGNKVLVELDRKGNLALVTVQDQGIGIKESKKDLVFQSFANIHEPSEMNKMSTGLGLSLAKEFIELHGGTIDFRSKEGTGTTFTIQLKLGTDHFDTNLVSFIHENQNMEHYDLSEKAQAGKSRMDEENREPVEPERKEHLLIVDDNKELRTFIRDIFSEDYTIHEAENGKEGLDRALNLQPQMIIADIMMPELDGIEMLVKLREDFSTSHIPVILLTSKSSVESRIEGIRYGADAYITKPFNNIHLKTLVESLIEQRKRLIGKFSGTVSIRDFTEEELVVTDKDGDFLKQVFAILEENLSDPDFKISVISRSLGMGRTYFFDKIKGLTSLSPIELVMEYRLSKASEFLKSGNISVAEVSFKAGFHDPGYFSRCFKEKYGKTPSQFMKEGEKI